MKPSLSGLWRHGWALVRRWGGGLAPLAAVALGLFLAVIDPLPLQVLRHGMYDQLQRWFPRTDQDAPVRIIDIDDESLRRVGQWPWPRSRLAELTERLQAAGPSVIAFDVVFAEPDRTSPRAMLSLWRPPPALRAELQALPDPDEVFSATIARAPVVLGMALQRVQHDQAPLSQPASAQWVARGELPWPYLHGFAGAVLPLPALQQAARGVGAIAFMPDSDGVVRRVPLLLRAGDALAPSLAAETFRVAQAATHYVTHSHSRPGVGLTGVQIGSRVLATTAQAEMWLHYSPAAPARTLAAWKVLAGEVSPSELAGRMLLVGASAHGLMDLRFTPLGVAVPGVEIHAQALEQMHSGVTLGEPPWSRAVQWLILLLGGLAVGQVALRRGALWSLLWLLGSLGLLWAGVVHLFTRQAVLMDGVLPSLVMLVSYGLASLVHHVRSDRRQRWIRQAFSRYVSPNLVNHLIRQPGALQLGGRRQHCSFIFTDLAGFTAWLEGQDPAQAVSLLNDYLDGMIAVAFRHQATLERIVGDALVLMFSAPVVQPDHPRRALVCAWDLHRFSQQFVALQAQRGQRFGATRIGVHCGEVIVGNFGGKALFDYRALGDPINTAARLESANKHFGTLICVSQAILDHNPGWPARPIGRVLLKGKQQVLAVLEPLAPHAPPDADYLAAYALLQSAPAQALQAFAALAQARAQDALVAFQLARLQAGQVGDEVVLQTK